MENTSKNVFIKEYFLSIQHPSVSNDIIPLNHDKNVLLSYDVGVSVFRSMLRQHLSPDAR